jgi:hypothetical protein
MKKLLCLLALLSSCAAPIDPQLQARCGQDWGYLRKGMPVENLICASRGRGEPWRQASTEDMEVYVGMKMHSTHGEIRRVYVQRGRVVGWDAW